ncbi:HlyD family secretion protein [Vibrio variabilis]|uniref:HlyD family secretion protein n=1 Tax=Vibrio variabilis TaxID=990271 RepID=A0ABQ0J9V7_9VIBR|nr:HlyD family secretion protein [Vibrio variabilis]
MLVKPGDIVYEGQPIARLRAIERNSQLTTANTEIAQLEMDRLRYQHLISQTEPDFSEYSSFPDLVRVNQTTWRHENDKNVSAEVLIQHDIEHKETLIASMKKRRVSSLNQLKLIRKQLDIKETLYKEEMASYVDVLNWFRNLIWFVRLRT